VWYSVVGVIGKDGDGAKNVLEVLTYFTASAVQGYLALLHVRDGWLNLIGQMLL